MSQAGPSRLPYDPEVEARQTPSKTRSKRPRTVRYGSRISMLQRGALTLACASGLALTSVQRASALSVPVSRDGSTLQAGQTFSLASLTTSRRQYGTRAHYERGESTLDPVIVGKISSSTDGPTVVKVVTVSGKPGASSQNGSSLSTKKTERLSITGRTGQTATYLPNEHMVLFIGGQVSNGNDTALTNDVFALNVSSIATNFTSGSAEPWQQLSSEGLPPHAFAANAVVSGQGSDQLWLFGGNVNNCSDAAGWTWSPSGGLNSSWSPIAVSDSTSTASRKARAVAMKVPASLPVLQAGGKTTDSTAFMMLGGKDASAECRALGKRGEDAVTADMWSFPQVATTDSSKTQSVQFQSFPVDASKDEFSLVDYSTVTLPASNSSRAAQDGGKTMFLGGTTASNQFAPWDHFWVFDPWTWSWVKWSTHGEVPSARKGHSSTLLKDGKVLVMGGELEDGSLSNEAFLLDPSTQPALWSKVTYGGGKDDTPAPAKAYHSAILVDDVLIMGFGASQGAPATAQKAASSASSQSLETVASAAPNAQSSSSSLYYLDMSNPSSWKWSDSLDGLAQGRGAMSVAASQSPAAAAGIAAGQAAVDGANAAAQGAVNGANSAAAAGVAAGQAAANAGTSAAQAATDAANSAAQAAQGTSGATSDSTTAAQQQDAGSSGSAAPGDSATAASSDSAGSSLPQGASSTANSGKGGNDDQSASSSDVGAGSSSSDGDRSAAAAAGNDSGSNGSDAGSQNSSGPSTGQKSGAIVGSLLGAAALAAGLAGLYAYKKRRDAREEGFYRHSDMEKHGNERAPPVSMLWFNNLKRKNTTDVGRRQGDDDSSFTRPAGGDFSVTRNLPKRPRQSKVSTPFIESLVMDDDDEAGFGGPQKPIPAAHRLPNRDRYLDLDQTPETSPTGFANGALFLAPPHAGAMKGQEIHRLSSCESLGSDGNASHFSYPYLSAMHRPSYGQGMTGTPMSGQSDSVFMPTATNNTPQVPNESPRTKLMEQRQRQGSYSNAALAATWSPEVAELRCAALAVLSPQFGRNSMDSDGGETIHESDVTATNLATRGDSETDTLAPMAVMAGKGSSVGAQGLRRHSTNSPTVYPWATPDVHQMPHTEERRPKEMRQVSGGYRRGPQEQFSTRAVSMPVGMNEMGTPRGGESRRGRRSELRIVNRSQSEVVEESDA
ncbi:unnamed protein product [Sympodiomycopsis kandeliae]